MHYVILIWLVFAGAAQGQALLGIASVVDGDTLELHGEKIRLHGIDAVESDQICVDDDGQKWPCGRKAAYALQRLIRNKTVLCNLRDRDRYGRWVGICQVQDTDLGAWMVQNGWAMAYVKYSRDYIAQEETARSKARNIWSGSFTLPWEWRKGGG